MIPRLLPTLLLFATPSMAAAQAPGEVAVVPVATPAAYENIQPVEVDPLRDRFSIGLGVGGFGIAPAVDGSEGSEGIDFNVVELAVRYRLTPRIELELSTFGGRQTIIDNASYDGESYEGDLAVGSVLLAARYRFRPDRKLGWWLMGGLGAAVVAPHDASDEEIEDSTHPIGMIGIGGEYRFGRHWGIQSEMRLVSIGVEEGDLDHDVGPPRMDPARTVQEASAGASFTLGANFYF